MALALRTVALVSASPALSSILVAELASQRHLRVRGFSGMLELVFYARIATVDLLVVDLDDGSFDCEMLDTCDLPPAAQVVGLTSTPTLTDGVDEVIAKPMSPRYLRERVSSLLGLSAWTSRASNVEQLFPPVSPR